MIRPDQAGLRGAADDFAARMRAELERQLARAIPGDRPVAYVGFPFHANVGDSAIWLGARAALARLGRSPVYECDATTYSKAVLAGAIGVEGTIVIQGGGNLGDLWAEPQALRERVLEDFPDVRTVQLPQSIWFRSRPSARLRRLVARHERFTVLVREQQSFRIASDALGVDPVLCPDACFGLGPLPAAASPRTDVLFLARRDREARPCRPRALPAGVEEADWAGLQEDSKPAQRRRLRAVLAKASRRTPIGRRREPAAANHDTIAQARVRTGLELLGRGRVVLTDRLHGHLLSILLGIPHVILDNSYGKIRSTHDTWTASCGLAHWADDPTEGLRLAHRLAREHS